MTLLYVLRTYVSSRVAIRACHHTTAPNRRFAPSNANLNQFMPRTEKPFESRINEACEAYQAGKQPNIAKIARDYGLARES